MSFRVLGLSPDQFRPLFAMSDARLHQLGARRTIADDPRMPCRVSMEHAELGEELLLLNFEHQPANTPYRATHVIYVRKVADRAFDAVDTIPEVLASRLLAIRAFDAQHATTSRGRDIHERPMLPECYDGRHMQDRIRALVVDDDADVRNLLIGVIRSAPVREPLNQLPACTQRKARLLCSAR